MTDKKAISEKSSGKLPAEKPQSLDLLLQAAKLSSEMIRDRIKGYEPEETKQSIRCPSKLTN